MVIAERVCWHQGEGCAANSHTMLTTLYRAAGSEELEINRVRCSSPISGWAIGSHIDIGVAATRERVKFEVRVKDRV